jgi:hypothetical protein
MRRTLTPAIDRPGGHERRTDRDRARRTRGSRGDLGFIVLVRIVVVESKVASRVAEAGIDDRLALVLVLWRDRTTPAPYRLVGKRWS